MLTIKQILSDSNAIVKKKAKAFLSKVREFEEMETGHYVAFVDDGLDSWDIKLVVDTKTLGVKEFSCDCKSRDKYCAHKLAILQKITKGELGKKSRVVKKIVKKKLTEAEKLIFEIDDDEKLITWLTEKLNADSILLLSFKNDFNFHIKEITSAFILEKYKESKKAVIGRRKSAVLNEIPKVLDLMKPHLSEVLKYVFRDPENEQAVILLETVIDTMQNIYYLSEKSTSRAVTFFRKLVENCISELPQNSEVLSPFISKLIKSEAHNLIVFDIVAQILEPTAHLLSKDELAKLIIDALTKVGKGFVADSKLIRYVDLAHKYGIFTECSVVFEPMLYRNKYNFSVLDKHLELGNTKYIIETCEYIIQRYTPKYQKEYYEYMVKAGDKENNSALKWYLRFKKLSAFPEFEDFVILYNSTSNKDQEYEINEYAKEVVVSRNYARYLDFLGIKFYYWHETKNYDKILGKITDDKTVKCALVYQESLWEHNACDYISAVIKALIEKNYLFDGEIIDEIKESIQEKIAKCGGDKYLEAHPELSNLEHELQLVLKPDYYGGKRKFSY